MVKKWPKLWPFQVSWRDSINTKVDAVTCWWDFSTAQNNTTTFPNSERDQGQNQPVQSGWKSLIIQALIRFSTSFHRFFYPKSPTLPSIHPTLRPVGFSGSGVKTSAETLQCINGEWINSLFLCSVCCGWLRLWTYVSGFLKLWKNELKPLWVLG